MRFSTCSVPRSFRLGLMAGFLSATSTLSALAADACSRVPLSLPGNAAGPTWLSAVAWSPSLGKVLAVDAGRNRLLAYNSYGDGNVIPLPKGELPSLLTTLGDRTLVSLVGQAVESFDSNLQDHQADSIIEETRPQITVNQWVGMGDTILAFGHKRTAESFQAGLFRITRVPGSSSRAELLRPVSNWDYYLLGYDLLTSVGDTGYFLDLDGGVAKLIAVPPNGKLRVLPIDGLPKQVLAVPEIKATMNGPKDAFKLFAALEKMAMATGLFSGPDGSLLLLGREPAAPGTTGWWIYRIDPRAQRVVGKARLPTSSPFLSVAISSDTMFLFERGAVDTQALQTIGTMVTVPLREIFEAPPPPRETEICPRLRK